MDNAFVLSIFGSQLRFWQAFEQFLAQHLDGTCKESLLGIYQIADSTYIQLLSRDSITVACRSSQHLGVQGPHTPVTSRSYHPPSPESQHSHTKTPPPAPQSNRIVITLKGLIKDLCIHVLIPGWRPAIGLMHIRTLAAIHVSTDPQHCYQTSSNEIVQQ